MARRIQKRFGSRPFRKTRTRFPTSRFKRRRFNRSRKSSSYANRGDSISSFGYRAKKWSRRRWKSSLWNSTQQKTHYRTAAAWHDSISTPANQDLCTNVIYQAADNGTAFYLAGGGAIDVNGGTLPLFKGDVIIRGGVLTITTTFVDSTITLGDYLRVKIYMVKAVKNVNLTGFNSITNSAPWDLTMFPEFSDVIGKVLMKKEYALGVEQGSSRTTMFRIPCQKIDVGDWTGLGSGRYYWVVIVNNPVNPAVTTCLLSFNMSLSFSADAIGTT